MKQLNTPSDMQSKPISKGSRDSWGNTYQPWYKLAHVPDNVLKYWVDESLRVEICWHLSNVEDA